MADPHHRLSLYKRLTACSQVGELALLQGEMQDRYGPSPEPVERLLDVMQLRTHAKRLRLTSIEVHGQTAKIVFHPKAAIPEASVHRLMDQLKKRLRFVSPISFEIDMRQEDWPALFSEFNAILQSLDLCDTKTIQKGATAS